MGNSDPTATDLGTATGPRDRAAPARPSPDRSGDGEDGRSRWAELPRPVAPEEMVLSEPATAAPDPSMGRDPDRDWFLRHA